MKKFLTGLFLLGAVFFGAYYAGRLHHISEKRALASVEKSPFIPSSYPILKHSFAIVVVGYNNGASVEKTLTSIFSQTHEFYRLIYIDDASDDGSYELARELIYREGDLTKVTLVRNEERLGHLANVVRAVQTCGSDEIVVVVNGDDWLAHEWVLSRLNEYYANPDLWVTYGKYLEYPHYSIGNSRPIKAAELRQAPFTASHLKTFYAGLFKQIPESEFTHVGTYYPAAGEMAYMFPLLEMAAHHSSYIDEVLYILNRGAPLRDDREAFARCEKIIRSGSPFLPVHGFNMQGVK